MKGAGLKAEKLEGWDTELNKTIAEGRGEMDDGGLEIRKSEGQGNLAMVAS